MSKFLLSTGCLLIAASSCESIASKEKDQSKVNRDSAISIYVDARIKALTQGIISKEKFSEDDSSWMSLLRRNPDSALEYAQKVLLLVENKELKSWPAFNSRKAIIDSADSRTAYGIIKFGITQKEYDKLPKKEKAYYQNVGEYEYMLTPIFDRNGKLYMINLESFSKTANYLDNEVLAYTNNLIDVISKKYGEPEILNTFPTILNFQPGYVWFTRQWDLGDKIIKVGAAEESRGSEYKAVCWILNKPLFDSERSSEESDLTNKQKEDASKF